MRDTSLGGCRWLKLVLAVALLIIPGVVRAGDVFRVDSATGADDPDCGSLAKPCLSIQHAVDLSASGDTIKVAQGTYTHTGDPFCSDVVCIYATDLTIIGGFTSSNWEVSNPAVNVTEIDGEDIRRGVEISMGGPAGNSTRLELRGFTIKRGRAQGFSRDGYGGGLRCGNADLFITDVVFQANVAIGEDTGSGVGSASTGGGLHISSCPDRTPTIPALELHRVVFTDNRALGGSGPVRGGLALGGGLFVQRARVSGSELLFQGNQATAGSSAGTGIDGGLRADALGGAAYFGMATSAMLDQLTATTNAATGGDGTDHGGFAFGGAIFCEGKDIVGAVPGCPAPDVPLSTTISITDAHLQENESTGGDGHTGGGGKGGGVAAFRARLNLDRVSVIENRAEGGVGDVSKGEAAGGGTMIEHPDADSSELRNAVIADNQINGGGGGGGGIRFLGADGRLFHTTVARNTIAPDQVGQGVLIGPQLGEPSDVQIDFSIIADHTGVTPAKAAVHVLSDASSTFDGGLFAGNDSDTNEAVINSGDFFGLGSTTTAGTAGFVSPGPPNFDYHLAAGSAAIDNAATSDAKKDFDRQSRPSDRDLGADERCSVGVSDLSLADETVTNSVSESACNTITAEDYLVSPSGDVLLQAGISVVLKNGFVVQSAGTLVVTIETP